MKFWTIAGMSALLASGTAEGATLKPLQGQVLVNHGSGYQAVTSEITVKPGDSILVNPKGLAQLTYDECATFEITPGDVVYVADKDKITCVAGAAPAGGFGALGANGLVVGGLAVAIGVGVVVGVSSGSDSPSSP